MDQTSHKSNCSRRKTGDVLYSSRCSSSKMLAAFATRRARLADMDRRRIHASPRFTETRLHMTRTTRNRWKVENAIRTKGCFLNVIGTAEDLQSGSGRKGRCPVSLLSTHKAVRDVNPWKAPISMVPMSFCCSWLFSPSKTQTERQT